MSHLHQDHFDPRLLSKHVSRAATVLLPDFPVPDLRDRLERLGFTRFCTIPSGREVQHEGLRLMVQALASPADGPLGDSLPLLPVMHQPPPRGPGPAAGGGWQAPPLDELRLHQGTVWRWNRAIYDPASGGHLRIEMRALPAGPTVIDMLANAAFLIGLSLWLAKQDPQWTYALPFERADHGFYRAAQHGLSAQLAWPAGHRDQIRTRAAAKLVAEQVPAARQGLLQAGVAAAEAGRLLGVISARAATGQTGAAWQCATLAATQRRHDPERALAVMLDRYLECADTGLPVHTWPATSRPA